MDAVMFQAEVRRIEKLLYRIAWSYLGNNADVEDAVQDALIKAYSHEPVQGSAAQAQKVELLSPGGRRRTGSGTA